MCYNVAINASRQQIQEAFNLSLELMEGWDEPRKHITIHQSLPAITETEAGRGLEMMYWGFTPAWMKDPKGGMKPANARADTISSTPMFRSAFKSHRCIVPATGFYEWQGVKGQKVLVPFTVPAMPLFALPGIWDEWTTPDGTHRRSLAILTTEPNADIQPYHDRMPVILGEDDVKRWLSPVAKPTELQQLLLPLGDGEVIAHPDQAFKPSRM